MWPFCDSNISRWGNFTFICGCRWIALLSDKRFSLFLLPFAALLRCKLYLNETNIWMNVWMKSGSWWLCLNVVDWSWVAAIAALKVKTFEHDTWLDTRNKQQTLYERHAIFLYKLYVINQLERFVECDVMFFALWIGAQRHWNLKYLHLKLMLMLSLCQ